MTLARPNCAPQPAFADRKRSSLRALGRLFKLAKESLDMEPLDRQWIPLDRCMDERSKLTAVHIECLARMPWPIASLASCGIRPLSSAYGPLCST